MATSLVRPGPKLNYSGLIISLLSDQNPRRPPTTELATAKKLRLLEIILEHWLADL